MALPSLFIGSSTESLEVARTIGDRLADVAEVTIWDEGLHARAAVFDLAGELA
jgi:hypothetical protein